MSDDPQWQRFTGPQFDEKQMAERVGCTKVLAEFFDLGFELGVAAEWPRGEDSVKHAKRFSLARQYQPSDADWTEAVEYLRAWRERHPD
jgi:hypothetical protein